MAVSASAVASAHALLVKYGAWLRKYNGGIPVGFLAAIMDHESGGNFGAPGDASLGEVGFFQVAKDVPPQFGMPAASRTDPETNVAIAVLEYEMEAVRAYLKYPQYIRLGTTDSWLMARLAFAIGRGGSQTLANAAIARGLAKPGNLYGGIVDYVRTVGAPALGSQSSAKVAARVASIPDLWAIGQAIEPAAAGHPVTIPQPPAARYTLPASIAPYIGSPLPLVAVVAAGALGVAYLLWRRFA